MSRVGNFAFWASRAFANGTGRDPPHEASRQAGSPHQSCTAITIVKPMTPRAQITR
jgi:hypothetical protein